MTSWKARLILIISIIYFPEARLAVCDSSFTSEYNCVTNVRLGMLFHGYPFITQNQQIAGVTKAGIASASHWKVGCSIHGHWVNRRSALWARAITSSASAKQRALLLKYSKFASKRPYVRTWGRQSCFFPWTPSSLAARPWHVVEKHKKRLTSNFQRQQIRYFAWRSSTN